MCGIAGIFSNSISSNNIPLVESAVKAMHTRGPDNKGVIQCNYATLGHARLSIIDTSSSANQPFYTQNKAGILVFNGEIFNYKELAHKYNISSKLKTHSDTEVLAELLLIEDTYELLNQLNGFFAFAFYNTITKQLIVVRDRYGVKPLYYSITNEGFKFASELKGLLELGVKKEIDLKALNIFLHLNYIPAPYSIFNGVKKLLPGSFLEIKHSGEVVEKSYYKLGDFLSFNGTYDNAKIHVRNLLTQSVKARLLADVPLGSFLSGGIDSSIITALAAQEVNKLNTFSIGFADEPFFDETNFALAVSKKYNTHHHVFKLTNNDLFEHLYQMLDYLDEPFADSSALNVFILCKHTKQKVTVALSGDGADELFAGYNKHAAELFCRKNGLLKAPAKVINPILKKVPQSRNSSLANKIRQANKLTEILSLKPNERYWRMAGYTSVKDKTVLNSKNTLKVGYQDVLDFNTDIDFNQFLLADQKLVLEGDMLVKVDRMSMAQSIEVREPFLDYRLVDFVNQLPANFKIDNKRRKKILIDAFADLLPNEILNRGKKGFEVPLLKWFNNELKSVIMQSYLSPEFIKKQGLFNDKEINLLLNKLFSNNPGDSVARVWGLIVFQHWYKKYFL